MIYQMRIPEAVLTLLHYVEGAELENIKKLFHRVEKWGNVHYPSLVGDEESEFISEMVERADIALSTLKDYERIYSGSAYFNGLSLIIVEQGEDLLQMMYTLQKSGPTCLNLSLDTVVVMAIDKLLKDGQSTEARTVALQVANEALEHLTQEREPRTAAALALAAYWLPHRIDLVEICTSGHYDYHFEYLDRNIVKLVITPKAK